MKILLILSIALLTFSCAGRKVRPEDLDSWKGQPTSVLEKHRIFSALPREERPIPESMDKLINYTQRRSIDNSPRQCVGTGLGFGPIGFGSSLCSPREIEDNSCVHQFVVRENKVEEYRVLGKDCYTECEYRPQGRCPDEK